MIEDKFSENLLNSIKEKKIEPKPRWHFLLKESAIWVATGIFLLVSAVTFSSVVHMFRLSEIGQLKGVNYDLFELIFMVVPLFWLVLLIGFVFVVYYNFKITKRGYRYSAALVIIASLLASAGLGAIFFAAGAGEWVDDLISRSAPENFYYHVINPHMQFWSTPEKGRLMGLVIAEEKTDQFDVVDLQKKKWLLYINEVDPAQKIEVRVGLPVRALGKEISDNEFQAEEILPLGVGRKFFMRMRPGIMGSEMMLNGIGDIPVPPTCCRSVENDFIYIFSRHPELKADFSKDLIKNKDLVNEIKNNDPDFIDRLIRIGIDRSTIEKLQK